MLKVVEYNLYFSPSGKTGHVELKLQGKGGMVTKFISKPMDAATFAAATSVLTQSNSYFDQQRNLFYAVGADYQPARPGMRPSLAFDLLADVNKNEENFSELEDESYFNFKYYPISNENSESEQP